MELLSRWRICLSFALLSISLTLVKPVWGQYSSKPSFRSPQFEEVSRQELEEKRRQMVQLQLQELETENRPRPDRSLRTHSQFTISVTQMKVPKKARNTLHRAYAAKTRANQALLVETALAIYPQYAEALAVRGLLEMEHDLEQALTDSRNAVKYDPSCGMAYLALGSTLSAQGSYDEAIPPLNQSVIIMPDDWRTYYQLSFALARTKNYTASLQNFERAHRLVATDPPYFHPLKAEILLGFNNHSAAIAELNSYLKEEPTGKFSELARRILEQEETTHPNN